jgi:hypothetical protein
MKMKKNIKAQKNVTSKAEKISADDVQRVRELDAEKLGWIRNTILPKILGRLGDGYKFKCTESSYCSTDGKLYLVLQFKKNNKSDTDDRFSLIEESVKLEKKLKNILPENLDVMLHLT